MKVEGETAQYLTAVRLDTLTSIEGKGVLLMADTDTGEVAWRDQTGVVSKVMLGRAAIRLVRRR